MINPKDERETPQDLYLELHEEFGFTLDAAASHINTKCPRYCTLDGTYEDSISGPRLISAADGIDFEWSKPEHVWCNEPFSDIDRFVIKAWHSPCEVAVLLLPQNRQEKPGWQNWIEPYRDKGELVRTVPSYLPGAFPAVFSTRNLPKRRHFTIDGGKPILNEKTGLRSSANFGILLLVWDRR